MPISARPACSLSPTALRAVTGRGASSRSVRGPGSRRGATGALLDAEEVRVERLVATVHLDLDVRVHVGEMLGEAGGVVVVGLGAQDDRDQFGVVVDQHV